MDTSRWSWNAVPERVYRRVGYTGRTGDVHAGAVRQADSIAGCAGSDSEKFREAVKAQAERQQIPVYQFRHKERKDDVANEFRRQRGLRDQILFIGVAQEKAKAFSGTKINGQFQLNRDKTAFQPLLLLH